MRKLLPLLGLAVLGACDLTDNCAAVMCYAGAPELMIAWDIDENTDSLYLDVDNWDVKVDGEDFRIKYEADSVWNPSDPFMTLVKNDTAVLFYGTGISWENLNDLQAEVILGYDDTTADTLMVYLNENVGECCTSHSINKVMWRGEEASRGDSYYYTLSFE